MKTDEQYIREVYQKYRNEKKKSKPQKLLKLCAAFAGFSILTVGVVFGGIALKNYINNAKLNPSFSGSIGNVKENKVWVGTFQIAWNELMDYLGGPIEFEDSTSLLADDLNKQSFNKDMLNEDSYYIGKGIVSPALKEQIENDLKEKFNSNSEILDSIDWNTDYEEYLIYSMLKKSFTFETPFLERKSDTFGNSSKKIKYFGLDSPALEKTFDQVTVLFYNSNSDFAVKIATLEGEEVISYRTDNVTNFSDTYNEIEQKSKKFTGRKTMIREKDELKIPFIKIQSIINYDELCNKTIKNSRGAYIKYAIQTVDFELNNYGGNLSSEAYIDMYLSASIEEPRYFNFTDTFVLYLKEQDKNTPYFALLVDNTDVLVED